MPHPTDAPTTTPGARLNGLRQEILDNVADDPEVRGWFLAKLDAFESAVRKVEDMKIAGTLREIEANPGDSFLNNATLSQVADQIAGLRR